MKKLKTKTDMVRKNDNGQQSMESVLKEEKSSCGKDDVQNAATTAYNHCHQIETYLCQQVLKS